MTPHLSLSLSLIKSLIYSQTSWVLLFSAWVIPVWTGTPPEPGGVCDMLYPLSHMASTSWKAKGWWLSLQPHHCVIRETDSMRLLASQQSVVALNFLTQKSWESYEARWEMFVPHLIDFCFENSVVPLTWKGILLNILWLEQVCQQVVLSDLLIKCRASV